MHELLNWPLHVAAVLTPQQRETLERLLVDGVLGHSDYSGKRCMESSFAMMAKGWRDAGLKVTKNVFAWRRTSDSSTVCQELALKTKFLQPLHVFQNVMDRVPPRHRAALTALRPSPIRRGTDAMKKKELVARQP